MLKTFVKMTVGVSSLILITSGAQANNPSAASSVDRVVRYTTFDTTLPMTQYEVAAACTHDAQIAQTQTAEVSTRLTGAANSLQVYGYYGQQPVFNTPSAPNQQIESFCYLEFTSHVSGFGFSALSLVHHTHLSSGTWDTACKPEFDTAVADPDTIVTNYIKSATLFQGKICEVTTVKAAKK